MINRKNSDWSEFYDDNNYSYYNGTIDYNTSYYIFNAVFSKFHDIVLLLHSSSSSSNILIESTLFHTNEAAGLGCNIHSSGLGSIIQKRICAYNCTNKGIGQHCYILNWDSSISKNYNIESSYLNLGNSIGQSTIYHGSGEIIIKRINISCSKTDSGSVIQLGQTNYEGNITFSILNRNTASYQHCLRLNSNKPYSIINCDIKNNTVLDQFIFAESGEFTFKDCIIIKNNAVNTFYGVESSKSILIHCYLEINGTFEFVEIESLSASSFENELYFLSLIHI